MARLVMAHLVGELMSRGCCSILLLCLGVAVSAQSRFRPAEYAGGPLPVVPVRAVGGGEVMLELAVTRDGSVTGVKPLRSTPPFTETFTAAAKTWRFRPAQLLGEVADRSRPPTWESVDATVLVAGVVRAPTLNSPTLGEPSRDVGAAADTTPFPLRIITPPFPPLARDDGSVLVQVMVDAGGKVSEAKALTSSPGFGELALTTARTWSFRPARVRGEAVGAYAYLVFAFRQPVTGSGR
jgi:TonB family protein